MKKLWIFTVIFALFFLIMSDNAFSKSEDNKKDCEEWCYDPNRGQAHDPKCEFCDSNVWCGDRDRDASARDYDPIKSFTEGTGHWHACGLSEYGEMSIRNRDECNEFCDSDSICVSCSDSRGCGTGYTSMRTFGERAEQGEKWHACRRSGNEDNRVSPCYAYYEFTPLSVSGHVLKTDEFEARMWHDDHLGKTSQYSMLKDCTKTHWRNRSSGYKPARCTDFINVDGFNIGVFNYPFVNLEEELGSFICRHYGVYDHITVTVKSVFYCPRYID